MEPQGPPEHPKGHPRNPQSTPTDLPKGPKGFPTMTPRHPRDPYGAQKAPLADPREPLRLSK